MEITKTKELALLQTKVSKAVEYASGIVIKDDKGLKTAALALEKVREIGDTIKAEKEKITKPANEILKNARAFFNPVEDQWRQAETILRGKMVEYHNAQEAAAKKEEVKIEKQFEKGKITGEEAAQKLEVIQPKVSVEVKDSTIKFKTIKDIEIVDKALIPDEYWELDMVKVRKVALAGVEVPGVKVVEKKITSF